MPNVPPSISACITVTEIYEWQIHLRILTSIVSFSADNTKCVVSIAILTFVCQNSVTVPLIRGSFSHCQDIIKKIIQIRFWSFPTPVRNLPKSCLCIIILYYLHSNWTGQDILVIYILTLFLFRFFFSGRFISCLVLLQPRYFCCFLDSVVCFLGYDMPLLCWRLIDNLVETFFYMLVPFPFAKLPIHIYIYSFQSQQQRDISRFAR